jgi:hypothetical protein
MPEGHFRRERKISLKQAEGLVLDLANYSDWQYLPGSARPYQHFTSIEDLQYFCDHDEVCKVKGRTNLDVRRIVERACAWSEPVQSFQNLVSLDTLQVGGTARGSISVADPRTGGQVTFTGPGLLVVSDYRATFRYAVDQLEDAIANMDHKALGHALTTGFTSIETYIRYRSYLWNLTHTSDQLVDDEKTKVPFDNMVDDWIPKMTGRKLDKSGKTWQDFVAIKDKRHHGVIHIKEMAYQVTYPEFASLANKFTTGIAALLFEMHKLFGEMTPSSIVKASYAPPVVWAPESGDDAR